MSKKFETKFDLPVERGGFILSGIGAYSPDAIIAEHDKEIQRATKEICICAAVMIEGRIFRGQRHGDCFVAARARLGEKLKFVQDTQGFITSTGRFVGRAEGRKLQDAAGIKSVVGYKGDTLFSEDLY